ncbi:DUF4249 domain-containing protein [Hymenobacter sp. J193]|uniref:DUF4249 domain-containing protein n=1 Tax=Hymenobacter sp. J193 TaxID=2898429 RepID=UPI002151E089|nr:DUF4249 domain-containing protein [Hymenobacter sp. J193]MCR5887205.1 DUF4249 domain-containing protein [Hymenobacter sp. J193]
MKPTLFQAVAIVLPALLAGCEMAVDVPMPEHTPRLALNYVLSNQVPDSLYWQTHPHRLLTVSVSQNIFTAKPVRQPANATVELLDANGQVVDRFRGRYRYYNPVSQDSIDAYYVPQYGFAGYPGHRYTLRASMPGMETAESSLTLPAPATVSAGSFVRRAPGPGQGEHSVMGRLSVSVPDPAASADYYVATARVLDTNGRLWGVLSNDYENDPEDDSGISIERFQLSESYNTQPEVYADLNVNGRTISLTQNVRAWSSGGYVPGQPQYRQPAFVEVTISTLTREAYDFYQSAQRYQDSNGNPFAEPAPLASNVRNGYGLFGGATDVTYRIPIQ